MLARRREQIVVLLGLLALNAVGVWHLRKLRASYRARTEWVYAAAETQPGAKRVATPAAQAPPQNFAEIAARDMFRLDRGSESAAEKVPPPELPLLFGTMNLGDGAFALMAPGNESSAVSKKVLPGGEIGGYKLVSIATSQVVVEWQERKFTIDVSESARRVPRVVERSARTATPARSSPTGTSSGAGEGFTTVAPNTSAARSQQEEIKKRFTPAGYNAPPGAPMDAPPGTIFGGKQKFVGHTPMGDQIYWKDVEQPKASEQKEPPK